MTTNSATAEDRLAELGIQLPEEPTAASRASLSGPRIDEGGALTH